MVNWFVIIILVALIALLIFRSHRVHSRLSHILMILGIMFLVLSIYVVYVSQADLSKVDGILSTSRVYLVFLGNIAKNMVHIAGYAIHQDWAVNITNSTIIP
ncbi:MAG: hypothetical protein Q7S74_02115 [Nanoarchaeota archaeon]|nr:hypothetical protein [Nanoarchaeota archaeon]